MISEKAATAFIDVVNSEEGREVDPFVDSQLVRLVAVNLELAVRNLIESNTPPECLTLCADIGTCRLVAMPTRSGDVRVLVFE
ncbi:MAG: hypothetical protein ACE5H4_14775 [Candidatus Thorarchaeota archaeon]